VVDAVMEQARSMVLPAVPHQNWFAVALSDEVAPGAVVGVPFVDGRLAVFRRDDGTIAALSARCAHMGADLAAGEVVDDELRCMFHHFCYGADGVCTRIPSGGRPPATARVHSFPVAESVGLVWVFNGESPPGGPPGVAGYATSQLAVRARRHGLHALDAGRVESQEQPAVRRGGHVACVVLGGERARHRPRDRGGG